MTKVQLNEMLQRESIRKLNPHLSHLASGVCACQQKQAARETLVSAPSGEAPCCAVSASGASVTFRVRSRRPCDWDNYSIKEIQDCLVESGLLSSDDWDKLRGNVESHKAITQEEEGTEIVITYD